MKVKLKDKVIELPDEPIAPVDPAVQIMDLKKQLTDTDYIVIKIAEGVATVEEYADIIAKRKEWREEINRLESELLS